MNVNVVRAGVYVSSMLLLAGNQAVASPTADLNPAERQLVEAAAVAYERGDPVHLIESLSRLVAKVDDKKLNAIDEQLTVRGAPSAGEMLAEARLAMVQQALASRLSRPGPRESLLILKAIDNQVRAVLQTKREHPAITEPIAVPNTSAGFEIRLWEVHVLHSRLEVARRMVKYMGNLAKSYPRPQLAKLSEDERKLVDAGPGTLQSLVAPEVTDLDEREVELRIHRLAFSHKVLENPELTPDRLLAAFNAEFDGRLIAQFFEQAKKSQRTLGRDLLKEPTTQPRVATQRRQARAWAGDLAPKAQLLFEGLHWWMRGRYGRGPEVGGLAKSEWALKDPQGQIGLYMPSETPSPTDPAVGASQKVPTIDRRHHYLWAMEDRRVLENTPAFCGSGAMSIDFW